MNHDFNRDRNDFVFKALIVHDHWSLKEKVRLTVTNDRVLALYDQSFPILC